MLSRGFDILQRAGGMEQISQLMVIVYGVLCVFGLLNCILGYRILRFWMMMTLKKTVKWKQQVLFMGKSLK